ncbi:MAG TPA: 2-phosphosulfolactate phosphatase [Longimicrobium sp.]|nr:2-phosphosulfolactate phosphatase [Longimicrobium sp.]
MRVDVFMTPADVVPADLAGRAVVVIDVLRASSSIVEAMAAGARTIFPVGSIEEAIRLANTLGRAEVLLCGERRSLPIEGFDLGNSPGDFTPERVGGKTLVMTTTNGTAAMATAAAAARVTVGALLNLAAVVDDLVRTQAQPVFLCSGREGRFGLDDAVAAGRMVAAFLEARPGEEWTMNDGARAALALGSAWADAASLFAETAAGRQLVEAGFEADLAYCAQVDLRDALPVLHDRSITLATPGAALSEA